MSDPTSHQPLPFPCKVNRGIPIGTGVALELGRLPEYSVTISPLVVTIFSHPQHDFPGYEHENCHEIGFSGVTIFVTISSHYFFLSVSWFKNSNRKIVTKIVPLRVGVFGAMKLIFASPEPTRAPESPGWPKKVQ